MKISLGAWYVEILSVNWSINVMYYYKNKVLQMIKDEGESWWFFVLKFLKV